MIQYKFQDKITEKQKTAQEEGERCPYCGATIPVGSEICPVCGVRCVSYCTFCGAEMTPEDEVCPECGMSTHGIKCPTCGKISYRSFCPDCNTPLTRAAMKAVEKAKADPKYQEVQELINEAEALSEELIQSDPEIQESCSVSNESFEPLDTASKPVAQSQPKPVVTPLKIQEVQKKKEKLAKIETDINKLFEQMLPPAGSTPQEQRNFYSARKVEIKSIKQIKVSVKESHQEPVGWICNLCGCQHRHPSDCARPELGGRWVYHTTYSSHQETRTIETSTKVTITD